MSFTLLYAPQCPNCTRFMEALRRTPAAAQVRAVDVGTLQPHQLARVAAVPGLVMPDGNTIYGTAVFEWLKQFEGEVQLDGFSGENGALAFTDFGTGQTLYAESYSAFEPVN